MVGKAVLTIDWSREDKNMLAMSAPKITNTVRLVRTISGLPAIAVVVGAADAIGTSFGWGGRVVAAPVP